MTTRRHLLGGAFALLAGARALPAAAAAPVALRFDELYAGMTPAGLQFSPKVLGLRGQVVTMRGYAAPPLRADAAFLVLTRQPMAVCPFCSSDADWPADIVVVHGRDPSLVRGGVALLVRGRLEAGHAVDAQTGFVSQLRLRDAEFERP